MSTARPRRRRVGSVLLSVAGVLLLAVGAAVLGAALLAPEETEKAYGRVKTEVIATIDEVRLTVFEELPEVRLGVSGGMVELDRCDGTFTEMLSYERADVPPVWAAHNNCAGDVILPWQTGQQIRIAGDDRVFEVVDIRETSKIWASTDDLVGLGGDFALQTCYYGEDRMKFIGLVPVDA
ncbi:hypothetical protein [Microbacterium album]|uniref:Uncharacterized protein n=1 Tax=Microbacterium album TaxID=2053191 RepID=A0A917IE03_9MICO|nr:hypothetical protein [Microbacterium album]GGH39875.1 hypothetical protein GCM10010921_11400 [Microbacterium album]